MPSTAFGCICRRSGGVPLAAGRVRGATVPTSTWPVTTVPWPAGCTCAPTTTAANAAISAAARASTLRPGRRRACVGPAEIISTVCTRAGAPLRPSGHDAAEVLVHAQVAGHLRVERGGEQPALPHRDHVPGRGPAEGGRRRAHLLHP